jgi:hypothetical protein
MRDLPSRASLLLEASRASKELNMGSREPEVAWLIERRATDGPEYCYCWSGGFDWTKDSLKAIRFCRREDANQVAEIFEFEDVHITEHIWS